jgi:CDP-glucose 4,6-dehydratase
MEDLIKFWKNKRVLITGHSGFVGSWLFYFFYLKKIKVWGISLDTKDKNNLFYYLNIYKNKNSYICDINNYNKLENIIKKIKPNIIIHLAAEALIIKSLKNPIETYKTNIFGTLNILRIIKKFNYIKSAIIFTTDKVYKNSNKKKKFVETDSLNADDPYSGSKAASEIVINSYTKSYLKNRNIITVRAGNIIGGGDYNESRIVPDIIKNSINNRILKIRNKKSTRPWQHILDVIFIIKKLIEKTYNKNNYQEIFNIGSNNQGKNVEFILKQFTHVFPVKVKYKKNNFEKKYLNINSSKLYKKLKIKNCLNIIQSIKFTIEWYLNFYKNKINSQNLCEKDIQKYEENYDKNN